MANTPKKPKAAKQSQRPAKASSVDRNRKPKPPKKAR